MNLQDVMQEDVGRRKRKRVGRGIGSGRGKTCTRGTKGQGSRSGTGGKLGHEGGQMPLYRRLPKRGFSNHRFRKQYAAVNVGQLEKAFEAGETVSLTTVQARGLVKKNAERLKVLGDGELTKSLTIEAAVSAAARTKIEAVSGTIREAK